MLITDFIFVCQGTWYGSIEEIPQSKHRYYVQHIYNNFKKRFIRESMKEKIWEISTCTTIEEFEQLMEAMDVLSPQAHQYLLNVA